jgi:hypothetical protein
LPNLTKIGITLVYSAIKHRFTLRKVVMDQQTPLGSCQTPCINTIMFVFTNLSIKPVLPDGVVGWIAIQHFVNCIQQNQHRTLDDGHFVEERMDLLLNEPYKIKGISVGFITLMLYLLDKEKHLIWFQSQHKGLMVVSPDLEKYTGKSRQYAIFNRAAKDFAKRYQFDHTELDWIFAYFNRQQNNHRV